MAKLTLAALLGQHNQAEILCMESKRVVRRLTRTGATVLVDAISVTVEVPADTKLTYEAWIMDRGSILFAYDGGKVGKLCTEFDTLRFPDGTTEDIEAPIPRIPMDEFRRRFLDKEG